MPRRRSHVPGAHRWIPLSGRRLSVAIANERGRPVVVVSRVVRFSAGLMPGIAERPRKRDIEDLVDVFARSDMKKLVPKRKQPPAKRTRTR
jgi:hypothetical protein